MWATVRENGDFLTCKIHSFITVVNYTIFAPIIDAFMSNEPSVAYVRELLVYVFRQKVLPYLNNFTNQHRTVCQRQKFFRFYCTTYN